MITDLFLWSNVFICLLAVFVLIFRWKSLSSTLLLLVGLGFLASLSLVDLQTLNHPAQLMFWRKFAFIFEFGVVCSFYFYTKTLFRDNSNIHKGPGFWLILAVATSLLCYLSVVQADKLIYSPDFAEEHVLFLSNSGFLVYLLFLSFLVFGLVQLERTYSGLHQLQRWSIKLEIVGSGLLLAAFAIYFSQNLLYRSINLDLLWLRCITVLVALSLIGHSRLFRDKGPVIELSRGIAHRSFVLLIIGGYLILLGLIGEGLNYLNLADGQMVLYVLLLVGSLGLAGVFLSEKIRRKLLVILHKNFYQSKYDYREQWELFSSKISSATTLNELQTSFLDLFCEILACKGAGFYLRDQESTSYGLVATFNFRRDWRSFSEQDPLIVKLQKRDWIVNLAECDPSLQLSLISSFSDVKPLLVIPLHFNEQLEGLIVLGEQINTGEVLTFEDYDLLRMLARQTISIVQGFRLSDQLAATRELAAIGKVSTFVLHDLKNQVSGLSLMLENAPNYIDDPEFQQDMLETVDQTVQNMKGLISRLKNIKDKPQLISSPVDLQKIIADAVQTCGGEVQVDGIPTLIDANEEEIYKVVLNLLVNAREASAGSDQVRIDFGSDTSWAFVRVTDKGCGMNADFIANHLFKPFETTKKYGFGIGLYQCSQIVETHGGRIEVWSRPGEGSIFTLHLPLAPDLRGADRRKNMDATFRSGN